jgi:hypothetical protein
VLAVLVGAIAPGAGIESGCRTCAPGCPMHAQRIGCHHAKSAGCHRAARSTGLRSACSHAQDPAAGPSTLLRGIIPVRMRVDAELEARHVEQTPTALATRPLPEPPTGPPRSRLA